LLENTDKEFNLSQYYDGPPHQLRCSLCGGEQFELAWGDRYTAARCVKCKWEVRINEG